VNYDTTVTYGVLDDLWDKTVSAKPGDPCDVNGDGWCYDPLKSRGYATQTVTIDNQSPTAVPGISRPVIDENGDSLDDLSGGIWDEVEFKSAIDVVLNEATDVYLSAWQGTVLSPSSWSLDLNGVDAAKWQHDTLGMAEDPLGGPNPLGLSSYCYWDTDFATFVSGGPDTTNTNPENVLKCSFEDKNGNTIYDSGEEYLERNIAFSQIGSHDYDVFMMTDRAGANSIVARVNVNARPRLTVNAIGSGDGLVSSAPAGIECSTAGHDHDAMTVGIQPATDCTEVYQANDSIMLLAAPDPPGADGATVTFSHWEGSVAIACGSTNPCSIIMDDTKTATAVFKKASLTIDPPNTVLRVNQNLQFKVSYDPDGECGSCTQPPVEVTGCTAPGVPVGCATATTWTIITQDSVPAGLNVIEFPVGLPGFVKALNRGNATIQAEYDGVRTVSNPQIKVIRYKWQEK